MLLPSALVSSTCLPVSVFGTGPYVAIAAFLGGLSGLFATLFRSACSLPSRQGFFLPARPTACTLFPFRARPSFPRPHSSVHTELRILHLLSIAYASPPQLRSRLTQGRSALPWNPRTSGLDDSHIHLATHSGILPSIQSTAPFGTASSRIQCSPTSSYTLKYTHSTASVACFSPVYFRRGDSRLVSYYALFECVAASEPTS